MIDAVFCTISSYLAEISSALVLFTTGTKQCSKGHSLQSKSSNSTAKLQVFPQSKKNLEHMKK